MSSRFLSRSIAVAAAGALVASCTMNSQDPPPLGGPSEFGQSVVVAVNPDSLPQDGASQSLVTVTVRDADSRPLRNVTLRVETRVDNTPVDFGSLSARSIVTGADGRATFMYTAPSSPAVAVDAFTIVDIGATPIGTDFNNAVLRTAAIRLTVPGIIVPPGDMTASFTMTPSAPIDGQTVLFDASASRGSIVDYQWDFGDGGRSSGRTASHAYRSPGTYVVRLTLSDPYGRTGLGGPVDHRRRGAEPGGPLRLLANAGAGGRDGELQRLRLASGGRQLAVELYVGLRRRYAHDNRRAGGAEGLRCRRGLPGHALRH